MTREEAAERIRQEMPEGIIQKVVEYRGLFVFMVFFDDPEEGEMDPFYSVDPASGTVRDFSILTDADMSEIMPLFEAA